MQVPLYDLIKIITPDARVLSIKNVLHYDNDWGCERGFYYVSDQHDNRYSDDCFSAHEAWLTMTDTPCNDDYISANGRIQF